MCNIMTNNQINLIKKKLRILLIDSHKKKD